MPRETHQAIALLALLLATSAGGCSSFSRETDIAANQQADKKYNVWQTSYNEAAAESLEPVWQGKQAVRLTYRIDAGQLGAPLAISCVQAKQVAYQEVAPSGLAQRSIGVLDIQYPHPAGREGMALVGVVIQQQHGPDRGMPPAFIQQVRGWFRWPDENTIVGSNRDLHEAWVMDVPRAELDQIIGRLQSSGFYGDVAQRRGHVRVTSRIGTDYVAKDWVTVSELDGLMHRVRSHGQLVSYQGIAMPLEQRPTAPASVVAWRAMQGAGQSTEQPVQTLAEQRPMSTDDSLFGAPHQPPGPAQPPRQVARLPEEGAYR